MAKVLDEKPLEYAEKFLADKDPLESIPALRLTQDGFITQANRLAGWLFGRGERDTLSGMHIVDMLACNFDRLHPDKEYEKQPYYQELKRIRQQYGPQPYQRYISESHAMPGALRERLHRDWQLDEHPWIHPIRIDSPNEGDRSKLDFQVKTDLIKSDEKDVGLLVTYEPLTDNTRKAIEEARKLVVANESADRVPDTSYPQGNGGGDEVAMKERSGREDRKEPERAVSSGSFEEKFADVFAECDAERKKEERIIFWKFATRMYPQTPFSKLTSEQLQHARAQWEQGRVEALADFAETLRQANPSRLKRKFQ